jgi:hypothetical protein
VPWADRVLAWINVLFTKTLKKMKLDITHMLTKSNTPFYGIVPGNAAIPLGSVVLPVTFGESRDNYRTEYIKFEVADFETSEDHVWFEDRWMVASL